MTTKKILFIDHKCLSDADLLDCVYQQSEYDKSHIDNFIKLGNFNTGHSANYVRTGHNFFPVKPLMVDHMGWNVPAYDSTFKKTFADITDQRYHDIKHTLAHKPWLILWSGGVDSTIIISSVMRNSTPAERKMIKIGLNKISISENPHFFFDQILDNFDLIDSTHLRLDQEFLDTYTVIDGEPGDQLHASRMQEFLYSNPDSLTKNLRKDADQLIDFLSTGTYETKESLGRDWAVWFYENMLHNIDSQPCPVITYHDFYWWYVFNLTWTAVRLRPLRYQSQKDVGALQAFLHNFIQWFDNHDYQQWAMNNNLPGIKYGNNAGEFKLEAKRYIYSVDNNEWYLKFKTKKNSIGQDDMTKPAGCILSDFTRLTLKDDKQQILDLLPDHVI